MLHPSTQQLIRKLCELTEANTISWKEVDNGRCVFETEGYQVEIAAEPPAVRLLQNDGRELERADAADLATPWPDGEGTYATRVADMARRAGRIARGAETAIAKILSSLSAPPKKQPEPVPEPAALAFTAPAEKTAAIDVVTAGLDAQAKKAVEEPPVSHTLPEPAPVAVAPETETAIDRVLAVTPPPKPELKPEPPPVAEAKPAPQPEPPKPTRPPLFEARPSPRVMDLPPPFADVTMQPPLKPVTAPPIATIPPKPAPQPAPVAVAPQPAPEPKPEPQPAPAPIVAAAPQPAPPAAKSGFGSIDSFARAKLEPKPEPPKVEPPKPAPASLLTTGISARSSQTVESTTAKDYLRPAPAPAPRPVVPVAAAPAPTPAPAPEKKLERATTGPDVYKPWS